MDGSVLYTHAGPFPTPSSLPPLSLESNPCFSIINPSWIQDTAGRPFKSSGTSTESRVLVRVTDGLYARPLPMRHGIILKPLLFDRGGGNRWWTREASRTRAAFYSRACLPACLHTFFLLFLFFFFFFCTFNTAGSLNYFPAEYRELAATLRLPVRLSLFIFSSEIFSLHSDHSSPRREECLWA